jgi:hypothetical protein
MARDETPPFARGETYYNGGVIDPNDPLGLGGENLLGKEFLFEPNSQDQGTGYPAAGDPNGRPIRVRVVRNVSGQALKPGRLAHYNVANGVNGEVGVDGYTAGIADRPAGVIDEFLPAAGVPNNDLFYLVVDGPTQVTTAHTGTISIAQGARLVPATGTSRTSDDAGRVAVQDLTGATATLAENIMHRVGFADAAAAAVDTPLAAIVHLGKM